MFIHCFNLRHIRMVSVTQTTRKAAVQPSIFHSNVLCIRRVFAAQVQTKATAREMIVPTMHQKTVAEIGTRSFAERRPASLTQGRNSSVHFGQGFRKSVFKLFHISTKNAYSFIIVFQHFDYMVLLLLNIFLYRDPRRDNGEASQTRKSIGELFKGIVQVLKDTRFVLLIVIYSGFWILYFQMFGTVLWYLRDYVDMTPVNDGVNAFLSLFVKDPHWKFDVEHVTVINAGVIIALQLIVSRLVQKAPALPTMIAGIGCGTVGMFILGLSSSPWIFIAGIITFTLGEMTTHPKFISYIGIIAPADKTALYMGYS